MPPHEPTATISCPEPDRDALPTFTGYRNLLGLIRQLSSLGGCAQPIRLEGQRTEIDASTGEILRELKSKELPAGHLLVRCGNRRATRCPSCAELYRQDTYHLIAAGLRGGKNIPDQIAAHPRVFATLNAPSYGPVHGRRVNGSARCRCGRTHTKGDPLLGTPLDPEWYDYTGAVLWNAHAPALWARFMLHLRRTIAATAGLPQRLLHKIVRVSYAKVAEYQQRGLIHFHAVIRLDGPTGPYTPPPAWAPPELLADAIRITTGTASIRRSLQRTRTGGLTHLPTKTRASERRIALPTECCHSLKEHRERQNKERETAASAWRDSGLVFTTPTGGPLDPANLTRRFGSFLGRTGLRRIRFHDLRHSTATLLLEQGVDLVVIKELLGHAHIGVTAGVYAHVRLRLQRQAIDTLNAALSPDEDATDAPASAIVH
ncbi:replication initiator (plasmid) [Streptomyces sp. HUAS TT3]|uniref:replication initiator n=1 Tax=Streptomyces sp. HUAS TT3 TaxID=3447510 RepID=UPI003F65C14E